MRRIGPLIVGIFLPVALTACTTAAPPDFSLAASQGAIDLFRGAGTELTVTLVRQGGFSEDVTLSVSGAPTGVTVAIGTPLLTGSLDTSALSIDTEAASPEGSYTLTITGTGGEKTHTATVNVTIESLTASGQVVDRLGQPVPGVGVKIGTVDTLTGLDGSFSVEDLSVPYDVTVFSAAGNWANSFFGLSRSDPTLQLLSASSPPPNAATVSGDLSGVSAIIPADSKIKLAFGSSDRLAFGGQTLSAGSAASYTLFPQWEGSATVSGTLHALQVDYDAQGFPSAYPAYGSQAITLDDGDSLTDQGVSLNMAPGPQALSGVVQGHPSDFDLISMGLALTLDNEATMELFNGLPVASDSFSFTTPAIADATHTLFAMAEASTGSTGTVVAWRTGLDPAAGDVTLTLPSAPPALVSPGEGATGITTETQFSFSSPIEGAVNIVQLNSNGSGPNFTLVTTGTTVTIPDLDAEGLALAPGDDYSWTVLSFAPFADMDTATAPRGFLTDYWLLALGLSVGGPGPDVDMAMGQSGSHSFTTEGGGPASIQP